MTIEQNIIDLTAAVRELTAAVLILKRPTPDIYPPYARANYTMPLAAEMVEETTALAALERLSTEGLTSPAAEAETAAPPEKTSGPVVYRDDVVKAFKTLAAKNRNAAVEVLKAAGVAKLSEVPDDKLAKVLDWIFTHSQR